MPPLLHLATSKCSELRGETAKRPLLKKKKKKEKKCSCVFVLGISVVFSAFLNK